MAAIECIICDLFNAVLGRTGIRTKSMVCLSLLHGLLLHISVTLIGNLKQPRLLFHF